MSATYQMPASRVAQFFSDDAEERARAGVALLTADVTPLVEEIVDKLSLPADTWLVTQIERV